MKEALPGFTPHSLRRTYRSGLTRCGVDADLAEIMLGHVRTDLVERYDREPRYEERVEAQRVWEELVRREVGL